MLTRGLPFEPAMSLLAQLAGRVEDALSGGTSQLPIAEWFFGKSELVDRYRAIAKADTKRAIFGPQSLYTLMRILIEEAYDAPITQELTTDESFQLTAAVVASNSVVARGTDEGVGPREGELLAYELQIGHYYSRPPWMEELTRAHELQRLAREEPVLRESRDFVSIDEWLARCGLTASEQWLFGFALGSSANAWDGNRHPHTPLEGIAKVLEVAGLKDRSDAALDVLSADREGFRSAFAELAASGRRFIWELRPFNTTPFLRVDGGGLLLLGRPWMRGWLSEGFHYRAMRVAQHEDRVRAGGSADHVQRYTAFSGQIYETYCLELARLAVPSPARVFGDERYGKGGGQRTSDVAFVVEKSLVLFEVNARRVGAEPLLTGDPQDATNELAKLLVKKINQLGVSIGALLADNARLPDVDMDDVQRVIPVVVSAGRLWQTEHLWAYLDGARDSEKCLSLADPRVEPMQALDASEFETVLALAERGEDIADLLARKASGLYRDRDLFAFLEAEGPALDPAPRLQAVEATFRTMTDEFRPLLEPSVEGG